jgi:hypothetical protein
MAERMVRTQIYLPPKVHAELKRRAEKHGLTLALQIREALEDYLRRANSGDDELEPLDLGNLFEIVGKYGKSNITDGSVNHDKYIYGDPHGEKALERERLRAQLKRQKIPAVRERPATYKTKKRSPARRKGTRR